MRVARVTMLMMMITTATMMMARRRLLETEMVELATIPWSVAVDVSDDTFGSSKVRTVQP